LTRSPRPSVFAKSASAVSIRSHSSYDTGRTPRSASRAAIGESPEEEAEGPASRYLSSPALGTATDAAPGARSSSRLRTVSAASDLFVPMTPVGPRLSQPATYSPGSGSPDAARTRPLTFGMVWVRSSNGTPGSGTDW